MDRVLSSSPLIPVTVLIAAGLTPYAPAKAPETPKATDDSDLRAALADALRLAEVAEAVATERDALLRP
jgi:hypothetical protein